MLRRHRLLYSPENSKTVSSDEFRLYDGETAPDLLRVLNLRPLFPHPYSINIVVMTVLHDVVRSSSTTIVKGGKEGGRRGGGAHQYISCFISLWMIR